MNRPGSAEGNWGCRATDEMMSAPAFQSLRDLTEASDRSGGTEAPRAHGIDGGRVMTAAEVTR
jgi:hypothetical protein